MFNNNIQLQQFRNLSSWRKEEVTVNPHELYTMEFIDTMPNVFVITNPNHARLKIGISSIPREDSYEFKVEPNVTETLGRPIGSGKLYILNDSSFSANIIVYSVETEFDPQILKNLAVTLEGYNITAESEISGFKEGVILPTHDSVLFDKLCELMSVNTSGGYTNLKSIINYLNVLDTSFDTLLNPTTTNGVSNIASIVAKLESLISKPDTDLTGVETMLENVARILKGEDVEISGTTGTLCRLVLETDGSGAIASYEYCLANDIATGPQNKYWEYAPDKVFVKAQFKAVGCDVNYMIFKTHDEWQNYLGGDNPTWQGIEIPIPIFTIKDGETIVIDFPFYCMDFHGIEDGARIEYLGVIR